MVPYSIRSNESEPSRWTGCKRHNQICSSRFRGICSTANLINILTKILANGDRIDHRRVQPLPLFSKVGLPALFPLLWVIPFPHFLPIHIKLFGDVWPLTTGFRIVPSVLKIAEQSRL